MAEVCTIVISQGKGGRFSGDQGREVADTAEEEDKECGEGPSCKWKNGVTFGVDLFFADVVMQKVEMDSCGEPGL